MCGAHALAGPDGLPRSLPTLLELPASGGGIRHGGCGPRPALHFQPEDSSSLLEEGLSTGLRESMVLGC